MDLFAHKSLLFLLSFIGCCAAQDILPAGPLDAVLGRNVTITTLVNNPEYVLIIWNFNNGKEQSHIATVSPDLLNVSPLYTGRVSINKTNGNLFLSSLKSEDSGDYSVNIVETGGFTQTAEVQLRVLEPVSKATITSNLPEAIEHNSTVILTCAAKGSFLNFTWFNGTAPIGAVDKRITLKEEETSSTLTIAGVLRSDLVGPIYCTAANKLETEKSAAFNLTVYYGPDEVAITPSNPSRYIRAGSNFSLSCSASSVPPATIAWYRDQSMMKYTGPILSLETVEELGLGKQMAEYSCRAQNAKTQRSAPSPGFSFAVVEPISGVKITGPTAALIAGNSTANLSCQATSGAVTKRTWLKDNKPLSVSSRLVFSENMSSIVIDPLLKEDNGEYTCELTNPITTEKASYKMVVNFGPETVTVTGENLVEVNDRVEFTCSAVSIPPATFTWKINGTLTKIKTAQYLIEKAIYKNTGTYTCEAHNAITGKTATNAYSLSVKEEGALNEGLSDGAIAGIVIAVLVALGAAIALIIYCRQKVPIESPY